MMADKSMMADYSTIRKSIRSHVLHLALPDEYGRPMEAATLWDGLDYHLQHIDHEIYQQDDPDLARIQKAVSGKKLEIKSTGSNFEGLALSTMTDRKKWLRKLWKKKIEEDDVKTQETTSQESVEGVLVYSRDAHCFTSNIDHRSNTEKRTCKETFDFSTLSIDDISDVNLKSDEEDPSDMDMMVVDLETLVGCTDKKPDPKYPYYMESANNPGYVYIRDKITGNIVASGDVVKNANLDVMFGVLLVLLNEIGQDLVEVPSYDLAHRHGPAVTVIVKIKGIIHPEIQYKKEVDLVYALACPDWPDVAKDWPITICTHPSGWPDPWLIHDSVKDGVHVVPIPHSFNREEDQEWRISFSRAESVLSQDIAKNPTLQKAYLLVKLICKYALSGKYGLSTYHLKNTLYWMCTEYPISHWNRYNMLDCVNTLLEKLLFFVSNRNLPQFFINERNTINYLSEECLSQTETSISQVLAQPLKYVFKVQTDWILCKKEEEGLKEATLIANFIGFHERSLLESGLFVSTFRRIPDLLQQVVLAEYQPDLDLKEIALDLILSTLKSTFAFLLSTCDVHGHLEDFNNLRSLLSKALGKICENCGQSKIDFVRMLYSLASNQLKITFDLTRSLGANEAWNSWFISLDFLKDKLSPDQQIQCRLLKACFMYNQVRTHRLALEIMLKKNSAETSVEHKVLSEDDPFDNVEDEATSRSDILKPEMEKSEADVTGNTADKPTTSRGPIVLRPILVALRSFTKEQKKMVGEMLEGMEVDSDTESDDEHESNKLSKNIARQIYARYRKYLTRVHKTLAQNCKVTENSTRNSLPYIRDSFYCLAMLKYLHGDVKAIPSIFFAMDQSIIDMEDYFRKNASQSKATSKSNFTNLEACQCHGDDTVSMDTNDQSNDFNLLQSVTDRCSGLYILLSPINGVIGSPTLLKIAGFPECSNVRIPRIILRMFLLAKSYNLALNEALLDSTLQTMWVNIEFMSDGLSKALCVGLYEHCSKMLVYSRE